MQINHVILSSILLISVFVEINSSKCNSKNLDIIPGIIENDEINKRRLDNEESPNINDNEKEKLIIDYDYTTFDNYVDVDNSTKEEIKSLLSDVSTIYSNLLSAKSKNISIKPDSLIELIKTRCNINQTKLEINGISSEENELYMNISKTNHIVIFPYFGDFEENEEDDLIEGKYCLITRDLYPKGGVLKINKEINFNKNDSKRFFKNKIFHAITHILLFEPNLMKGLKLVKNNKVISEGVKQLARIHYNCLSFIDKKNYGIPLEEDGYHWDSRYMLGDYMISFDYYDIVISDITLALFDDSGLYNVDYLYGKLFNFGKNKTCAFFEKKCLENAEKPNFDDFCNINEEPKCSQSRTSKGYCYLERYDNNINITKYEGYGDIQYCPVSDKVPYINDSISNIIDDNYYFSTSCKYNNTDKNNYNYGEKFGNNSFCFISSLLPLNENNNINKANAVCYEVLCDSIKREINVNISNIIIKCPTNGGNISIANSTGLKGYLICPKYNDICFDTINETCNDMFDCINDKFGRNYTYDDDFGYFLFYKYFYSFLLIFIYILF